MSCCCPWESVSTPSDRTRVSDASTLSIDNRSEPIPFSPFPPFLPSDLYCPRTNFCVQSRGLLISVLITNLSARGTVPFSHEIGHHANLAARPTQPAVAPSPSSSSSVQ